MSSPVPDAVGGLEPLSIRTLPGSLFAALLAIIAGLGIAWVDARADEVVVAVVPLLIAGALLGLARPRLALLWGVLLGIWIPIEHWTGMLGTPVAPSSSALGPLLALIPATLGALIGAAVELAFSTPEDARSRGRA